MGVFMKEITLYKGSNEVLCWFSLNEVNIRQTLLLWENKRTLWNQKAMSD